MNDTFFAWVIYDKPSDFPDNFVARQWNLMGPTSQVLTAGSLMEVRKQIPRGLACLPRSAGDDPKIVETWV